MNHRKNPLSFLGFASLFLSIALLGAQGKDSRVVMVGLLKGPTGIGLERLIDNPPLLPGGGRLECILLPSVDLMVAKIGRGELDFASLPSNTAALLYKAKTGYSLAAVTGDGMLSFITTDPSIKRVEDLRDRKVQVSGQGAVPEFVFRTVLRSHGIDPDHDLSLLFGMAYPEAASSLMAGKVESALLPEPFATMALAGNRALLQPFDIQEEYAAAGGTASYPISVVSVKSEFASSRPEDALAVLNAMKASLEWVRANPAEAGALEERLGFGLPARVATASIPKTNYVFRLAKDARKELEALFGRILESAPEFAGGALPDDGFYSF